MEKLSILKSSVEDQAQDHAQNTVMREEERLWLKKPDQWTVKLTLFTSLAFIQKCVDKPSIVRLKKERPSILKSSAKDQKCATCRKARNGLKKLEPWTEKSTSQITLALIPRIAAKLLTTRLSLERWSTLKSSASHTNNSFNEKPYRISVSRYLNFNFNDTIVY